ncbi:MAG: multidrug effflux MFS transporter [Saprospiraceae bacterium]|nr:multidrug effflux MFS transporter [Saprospiraceae bacterium]
MTKKASISELEFILLMAFLMSNVALCIDAILPALPDIGLALHHTNTTDLQLMITMIFLGLGTGELFFGTLSDALGRKPIVYVGVGIFLLASLLCVAATSLEMMLLGRVLQGVGLSAPRTVSIAVIRDLYSGSNMARIMSFIKAIFIVVPMIAPLLGQWILRAFSWQAIFYFQLFFIGLTVIWFSIRQRETLPKEKRKSLQRSIFSEGVRAYFSLSNVVLYTLIAGLVEGSFILYLSNSQQIFQEQYLMVEEFPYIFAGLSFVLGMATFFNGAMVMRYGMKNLVTNSLYLSTAAAFLYVIMYFDGINPTLWVLLAFLSINFLTLGFIFGNLSAMALRPLGHMAGIGAALYSFLSMVIGVLISVVIGRFIVDSTLPVFLGLAVTGVLSLLLMRFAREDSPQAALNSL